MAVQHAIKFLFSNHRRGEPVSSASTCWIKSVFIVGLAPPDRSVRIWGLFGCNTATAFASQFMFSCDIHRYLRGACRAQRRRLPTWRAWELSPIYGDFTVSHTPS